MTVEEAIRAVLVADTAAAAVFGDRVYPGNPPDHTLSTPPWIAYRVTDEGPMNNLGGLVSTISEIEFDVLCANYAAIRSGVNVLRDALNTRSNASIERAHWQGTEFQEVQEGHFAKVKFVVQAKA